MQIVVTAIFQGSCAVPRCPDLGLGTGMISHTVGCTATNTVTVNQSFSSLCLPGDLAGGFAGEGFGGNLLTEEQINRSKTDL